MSFRVGEEPETESQGGGELSPSLSPITLTLPTPPSVNKLFRNVRGVGRVKSRAYKDWIGHAGWVLRSQRPGRISGRVVIVLSVEQAGPMSDIDNRVKALFDLLVAHSVIDDDRFVVGFCIAWAPSGNGLARLMILPAASLDFTFRLAGDGAHGGWFLQQNEDADADFPEFPADLNR